MKFQHIHVPKTGGISLTDYAKQNKLDWLWNEHRYYSQQEISEDRITITALRCPIKHTMSLYSFWNYVGPKGMEKGTWQWYATHLSFSDWLRTDCDFAHGWGVPEPGWSRHTGKIPKGNIYTGFFGDGDTEKAIARIRSIHHVLDTSNLTRQFNAILKKYKLPEFDLVKNTSPKITISNDDVEYIRKKRSEDFEICKIFNIETG
jgi:hypothetical protein